MAKVNIQASGGVGLEPPPDAPRETSQPLGRDAGGIVVFDPRTGEPTGEVIDPMARARQNERTLEPLRYGPATARHTTAGVQEAVHEVQAPTPVEAAPGQSDPPEPQAPSPVVDKAIYPAASNSDSPSRGIPGTAPIPKERKFTPLQPSGGFGAAEAEYFPLDGSELKTLVEGLLDEVHARIQNDIRFGVHLTYPRLTARVQIIVESEADDQGFQIEKMLPPNGKWDRTPLAVAQEHGDSVVFVVAAQRREFDAAGNVETPADAIREDLGVVGPRKRAIGVGLKKSFYDVDW